MYSRMLVLLKGRQLGTDPVVSSQSSDPILCNMDLDKEKQISVMASAVSLVSIQPLLMDVSGRERKQKDAVEDKPKKEEGQGAVGLCRMEDSPYRIMKVAGSGAMTTFTRLYNEQPSRLSLQDPKGWTVTHHAASRGRINVLTFIVEHEGDINIKDKHGSTPLHIAAEKNTAEAAEFLLKYGANTHDRNENNLMPIHVAVMKKNNEALKVLLEHGPDTANSEGEQGLTSMHYAADRDDDIAVKLLLEHNGDLSSCCHVGYHPTHQAAKQGSSKALEAMLQYASDKGYLHSVKDYRDKDNNTCLHAAVTSGNLQTVQAAVKFGCPINATQDDLSSPVHLASSQGNLEMIKSMFEGQPDLKDVVLFSKDANGMTPLHITALMDKTEIALHLIQQFCEIDSLDNDGRSPLLVAASNQSWRMVSLLLDAGASMHLKDRKNRNFLHLAILNNARLQNIFKIEIFQSTDAQALLNEPDDNGCTALHYASKEGHLGAIEHLIDLGAFLNVKNKERQSPLHFAARYGRFNTCVRLLERDIGAHIINETDGDGLTGLHLASQNGHAKIAHYLMQKGATLQRDNQGNTPLHLAAENGYTHTMSVLLAVHAHILNGVNDNGDTALHKASMNCHPGAVTLLMSKDANFLFNTQGCSFFDYAIQKRHKDVAMCIVGHERWQAAMDLVSPSHGVPMIEMIKQLPDVCLTVLDRCQTTSEIKDEKNKDFYYHFDFRYLQTGCSSEVEIPNSDNVPMCPLNTMVKFNRVDCLSHPVCINFLKMKWRAYGFWFHMINILLYVIFLCFLTAYVCMFNPMHHVEMDGKVLNTTTGTYTDVGTLHLDIIEQLYISQYVCNIVIAAFSILSMLKEVGQMIQQKVKYFLDMNNLIEWILYLSSAGFVIPSLFKINTHLQWECGAIAIFLAWFNLLLFLQRFDFFGIYVVMFLEILQTLVQVIVVFSILIVAFGLSFYILLNSESASHKTPALSLMRSFIMMLGEIDYLSSFIEPLEDDDPRTMHFSPLTFIFLVLFILLMPILLMNLLIGLAVGDIEAVQRNARLKRLAMQVEFNADLEGKIPKRILQYVDKKEFRNYPSRSKNIFTKITSKMFKDQDDDDGSTDRHLDMSESLQQAFIIEELSKQKNRIKDLSSSMEKQYDLLRLIVQKMEIRTEADERDVGYRDGTQVAASGSINWGSPLIRQQLTKQATVLNHWSRLSKVVKK